jgi:hypothetical protein
MTSNVRRPPNARICRRPRGTASAGMSGARGRGFCHPAEVQSDGRVLPDLREAYVLYRLGFVRTDDLPDLAARWLAAGLVDNESVRLLAGHDPHDPAMLDTLIADSVSEADVTIPSESTRLQEIAIDWVTSTWRHTGDTRWAISTLAQRGETYPEFDLGLWIGLDDEWNGGWGRLEPDLKTAAKRELDYFIHGGSGAVDS